MEDFDKILITFAVTIFSGFIIHAASQLFLKLFIEPLQNYRQYNAEAIMLLSFYSNLLHSRLRDEDEQEYRDRYYKAQDELRMCMANLKASYYSISPHRLATVLCAIPDKKRFNTATKNLLKLSFFGQLLTETDSHSKNLELAQSTVEILGAKW